MYPHHEQPIDRLVAELRDDPRYLAMIVGGSIAKGRERADSDVDLVLVATDAEFARRLEIGDIQYLNTEIAGWPGGYVEGKIVDRQFLIDAADHGSEPARSAFAGARIAYSRLPDLAELIARIPVYPEAERAGKMASFFSQVVTLNWFVPEAEKRADPYLRAWACSNLVLFGGRLILAHKRILFPYHKWFMYELRRAPDRPADLVERAEALLARPGKESAQAFRNSVVEFPNRGLTMRQAVADVIIENEWNWREGPPPLSDG
jgi:hypothetical protein